MKSQLKKGFFIALISSLIVNRELWKEFHGIKLQSKIKFSYRLGENRRENWFRTRNKHTYGMQYENLQGLWTKDWQNCVRQKSLSDSEEEEHHK